MAQTINKTKVQISENNQVCYKERTMLFGLVTWWERVSSIKLGNDLIIETDVKIENIYLNGELIKS